jgi:hypothetical protein
MFYFDRNTGKISLSTHFDRFGQTFAHLAGLFRKHIPANEPFEYHPKGPDAYSQRNITHRRSLQFFVSKSQVSSWINIPVDFRGNVFSNALSLLHREAKP